jgi:hypothetical protein
VVDAAEVPAVGAALADDLARHKGLGFVEGKALPECSVDGNFLGAVGHDHSLRVADDLVVLVLAVDVFEYLPSLTPTLWKDSLKMRSRNSSCMTTKPPEVMKRSLISEKPVSLRVKMKMSRTMLLATTRLVNES